MPDKDPALSRDPPTTILLTEAQAKLLEALDDLGLGFVHSDGMRVLHANRALARLSGYSTDELRAMPDPFLLLDDEDRDHLRARMLARLTGYDDGPDVVGARLRRKDGELVAFEIAAKTIPRPDGRMEVVAVARALPELAEATIPLARVGWEGLAVTQDGIILDANPALARLTGTDREHLLGGAFLGLFDPRAHGDLRHATEEGLPGRATLLREDGHATEALVLSRPLEGRRRLLHAVWPVGRAQGYDPMVARGALRAVLGAADRERAGADLAALVEGQDIMTYLAAFDAMGLGRLALVAATDGRFEFEGRDLLEHREGARAPTCVTTLAYVRAALGTLAHDGAIGTEIACQSRGDEACRFIVRSGPSA